jgi:6-pyruvoyltetrahydropterin/6-carboxytetrahydropterin synthase
MYSVAVQRDFIAQHFLIGGDWGAENDKHSHHYRLELQLQGDELDQHGYLVDILDIEQVLNAQVVYYRDQTLNDLPEFAGNPSASPLNPSIEHFSRVLCLALSAKIQVPNIRSITVKLWENEIAWASYQINR